MKLKKAILLFGAVCILNIVAVGCGSVAETAVKTEGTQPDDILPEEGSDVSVKDDDKTRRSHRKIQQGNGRF